MVGSFFGGNKPPDMGAIDVTIERTSSNTYVAVQCLCVGLVSLSYLVWSAFRSRRISASAIVDSSMDECWSILTDYNNLVRVPVTSADLRKLDS